MLHSSTQKLIDRLAEMTELGKLDWTEGESGDVIYSTEGYRVRLPESADEVVITSIDGKELERAAASDLAATHTESGTSYADIVAAMTKEANRIALGTETAISTLLAGMEPAPEPVEPEIEAETEEAEDPADETTIIATGDLGTPPAPAEPEPETVSEDTVDETETLEADAAQDEEISVEPEVETEVADEAVEETTLSTFEAEPEVTPEETVEAEADESESGFEPAVAAFSNSDDHEASEEVVETESEPEPFVAVSDAGEETEETASTESESELTEAVARMADEVNGREPSTLETAAIATPAAVATIAAFAASDTDEVETAEPEAEVVAASIETPEAIPEYIPFGLEDSDEEADEAPATATIAAPVTSEWSAPAPAEEVTETIETPEPIAAPEPLAASVETDPAPALETPEPAPSFIETPALSDTLVTTGTEPSSAISPEPEAAPAASYSLSGIGAGFGLGALATKSEASGIPGPSSTPVAAPDRVVIDATDDILPEPEGQIGLRQAERSASGVSLDASETASAAAKPNAEDDEESDILKPRTRFNPWD